MSRRLPSGSRLTLAFKCLGSAVLPVVKDEPGPIADEGKRKHAVLEEFIKRGRKTAEGCDEADADLCARVNATIPAAADERVELGLELFVLEQSVNQIVRNDDGSISDNGGFVAISDLVQRHSDASFSVWDYKSSGWVPDPEYNWQLILGGLQLYVLSGMASDFSCTLGIVYIGKPTDDGKFQTSTGTFDAALFERKLADLGRIQRRIESVSPETVTLYEGKHCQYCPARHRCPAKIGALGYAVKKYNDTAADADLVRIALSLMECKPQLDKAMKNILKENGGEMDLGDGRIAVIETKNGREKVYTKRAKTKDYNSGPDASEDGDSGAASE